MKANSKLLSVCNWALIVILFFLFSLQSFGQKAKVIINQDPNRPEGFSFIDSLGKESAYLTTSDLCKRNPYSKITLMPRSGGVPGNYQAFDTEGLSVHQIKAGLNNTIKEFPIDSVLEKAKKITASYNWYYDYQHENYLTIIYTLTIYDEELIEIWVESEINVYESIDRPILVFTDYHNLQQICISPDGEYMITGQVLSMIGDGASDLPIGMLLFNLKNKTYIGAMPNVIGNVEQAQYEQGFFLLYAYIDYDAFVINDNIPVKVVVDPENRKIYTKKYNWLASDLTEDNLLHIKSISFPNGEDIMTYKSSPLIRK